MSPRIEKLFRALEETEIRRRKSPFGILETLSRAEFPDADALIRFHEALLFLRAYPHDRAVLRRAETLLAGFAERVARLEATGANLSALDRPEVSGIAGTTISTDYSFDVVRWLARRFPGRVRAAWSGDESPDRLRALLPRFLPFLAEEALEDANVPYLDWLRAAQPDPGRDLDWLIRRLAVLPLSEDDRAERWDALELPILWKLGNGPVTRTRMRFSNRETFFHPGPLISRREVSLERELASPPLPVRLLTQREGRKIVDLACGATALRYREYYGFTYADPGSVRAARAGRGVEIFLMGLEPERRLPLRAGFAAIVVKNGVPVGYVEGLALFERIEVGFNIYYTFREGESAWIFARVLRLLHQILGVTSFSIDPWQLGHNNPEAIDSGAFWFYRKLGFRPTSSGVTRAVEAEERRISATSGYRSSPRMLRRLVTGNLLFETDAARAGDWDLFHVRNVGFAVQRKMRERAGGDPVRRRAASARRVAKALGVQHERWPARARGAFEELAHVLDLVPDLARWSRTERAAVVEIARAKAGREEIRYLRLLQRHRRLRAAVLALGSSVSQISTSFPTSKWQVETWPRQDPRGRRPPRDNFSDAMWQVET